MKMVEQSRLLSPNKQKVKRSQLAGMATTSTTFKSEWKKEFSFITSVPNDVIASKRCNWNCSYYGSSTIVPKGNCPQPQN